MGNNSKRGGCIRRAILIKFIIILAVGFLLSVCIKSFPESSIADILLLDSIGESTSDSSEPYSGPGVHISVTSIFTSENPAVASQPFTVVLSQRPASGTVVVIEISSSNTTNGATVCDTSSFPCVTASPISLTFTDMNWNVEQKVFVKGADDAVVDSITYFPYQIQLVLGAGTNDPAYAGFNPPDISAVNLDDDIASAAGVNVFPTTGLTTTESGINATFFVVLGASPAAGQTVTVNLLSSNSNCGTVPASISFTTSNWFIPKIVTILAQNSGAVTADMGYSIQTTVTSGDANYDGIGVADVSVNHIAYAPGVTVTPTTGLTVSENGTVTTFSMYLNSKPTADVAIDITSLSPAEAMVSKNNSTYNNVEVLKFTSANWNVPQTIYVKGQNDAFADGNINVTIQSSNTISADAEYDDTINPDDVSVLVTDDDIIGITVNASSSIVTTESGLTQSFTVVLNSEPKDTVTIPLSISDTSEASISSPFIGTSGTITFTTSNWLTSQTITIVGKDDIGIDGNINYLVILGDPASSGDPGYNDIPDLADISAINIDNDTGGGSVGVMVVPLDLSFTEGDPPNNAYIYLTSAPDGDVTIPFSIDVPGDGTISPASLTFNAGNWNLPRILSVTPENDILLDGTRSFNIDIGTITGSDTTGYVNLNPSQQIGVIVFDNDKRIFRSISEIDGAFAGAAGADAICAADAFALGEDMYTFKAVTGDATRQAKPNKKDWPLQFDTTYLRLDGITPVMTTNSKGIVDFSSGESFHNYIDESAGRYWTGIDKDWKNNSNCLNWSSASLANTGWFWNNASTIITDGGGTSGSLTCDNKTGMHIICVQQ